MDLYIMCHRLILLDSYNVKSITVDHGKTHIALNPSNDKQRHIDITLDEREAGYAPASCVKYHQYTKDVYHIDNGEYKSYVSGKTGDYLSEFRSKLNAAEDKYGSILKNL